jgi:hypothetical protein
MKVKQEPRATEELSKVRRATRTLTVRKKVVLELTLRYREVEGASG